MHRCRSIVILHLPGELEITAHHNATVAQVTVGAKANRPLLTPVDGKKHWGKITTVAKSTLCALDVPLNDFDLPRSFGVKYIAGVGLPIYDFLLQFNSRTLPNSAPPLQTTLQTGEI